MKNKKKYVGFTSKSIKARLEEHNMGSNKWTRANRPFKVIYYEKLCCRKCAILREKFWKTGRGREIIKIINKD